MAIVEEDDDIKERLSISDAEIEKRLVKEREMWERQKQREMREKGSSRRSRSRSRSPVGWLQRAARGGREAGARGGRGAGRGGGRAGGSGLQHVDYIPNLSSGHEEGITSESDADTRKWKEAERKKKKEEQKREEMEGVQVMVPVDILKEVMPVYLKEGFSTKQAIFAVATVLVAWTSLSSAMAPATTQWWRPGRLSRKLSSPDLPLKPRMGTSQCTSTASS